MTALALACLTPLYDACRKGQAEYAAAARTVGDPGLKLQFNHIAAARAAILAEIAGVVGFTPESGRDPEATPAAAPATAQSSRPLLGGEDCRHGLTGQELCCLVRRLRELDEHVVTQMRQHVDAIPCVATTEVLERAIALLNQDLDKIRILESLTAAQENGGTRD